MSRIEWPDDHPNAKILLYTESSRQVVARAGASDDARAATALLDELVALIDAMQVGKTNAEIEDLVRRVGVALDAVLPVMERVTAQVAALSPAERAANARAAAAAGKTPA